MLGFIKKDLSIIKGNLKYLTIILVIYMVMGVTGQMDMSYVVTFMSGVLTITVFRYDDFNHWDAYAATLPNGRKNSVRAKYLATIIILLSLTIFTTLFSLVITLLKSESIIFETILTSLASNLLGTIIFITLMYPIIYKFGTEKAAIVFFAIFFGIIILGGLIVSNIDSASILKSLDFLKDYFVAILIAVVALFLFLSYKLSIRFEMKKEF